MYEVRRGAIHPDRFQGRRKTGSDQLTIFSPTT